VRLAPGARIGYVPQRLAIDDALPLTVRRFLGLAAPRSAAIERALAETGVADLVDMPVQVLSGGEFQRVLLARALIREPDLLVLDEPVQGVDVAGQAALYDLIRRIRDRHGCGVLLVSHDLHLVMAATDRVVCLNHHVCCSGHPEAVARHPAYRALFGAAADAIAVYAHHHDHRHDAHGHAVPLPRSAEPPPAKAGSGG
jgi:zinc transport system ATP-binding protein